MKTESEIKKAKSKFSGRLMELGEVSGVGICAAEKDRGGKELAVYVKSDKPATVREVKQITGNLPVRIIVSGEFTKQSR